MGVGHAFAADWQINRFHSDISVQPDGRVKIVETLDVDFGSKQKHGILRDIPYEYQSDKDTVFTNIEVWGVTQDGQRAEYETSLSDGYEEIKIGEADATISGQHTYAITYFASGVLREFSDYDELYWNVTGNYWDAPINHATATVKLPRDGILQQACYQGAKGSTDECQSVLLNPKEIRFAATQPLPPGGGLTLSVGYTKGIVPILTVTKPQTPAQKWLSTAVQPVGLVALTVAALLGLIAPALLWWRKGRDWWWQQPGLLANDQTAMLRPWGSAPQVVVEYTPPENLRPAEIGLLMEEETSTLDVTATLIDLASRGYVTIKELDKTWLFGSNDYELTRTAQAADGLLGYEALLLKKLFGGKKTVKLSSLKNTFYDDLAEVKDQLRKDVMAKQYFKQDPEKVQNVYRGVAVGIVIVGVLVAMATIQSGQFWLSLVGAAAVAAGVGLLAFSWAMPQRTALGAELYRRSLGYKLFIASAEKHRQQFFEKENLFNQVMPYAILFGLTRKFAQAMKDIGYEPPQPSWYTGHAAFNAAVFSSNMASVSKAFSQTIASAPSSSGSGGGGFSGGGFGGGGGGSW